MKILEKAQRFIEFSTLSLEGKEDFVPFVIVMDERDREFFSGFEHMPNEPEGKDRLADMIMALCIVHGAVEVVFGSSAWSAETSVDDDLTVPPSQRPDRKEVAYISAANKEGVTATRVASMVREGGKVGVGLWEQLPQDAIPAGRFAEALHLGIKLSAKMPTEVRDYLREQIEAGLMEEVVTSTANVITEARRTAMKIERMWEK
jgi:hypothetical protein